MKSSQEAATLEGAGETNRPWRKWEPYEYAARGMRQAQAEKGDPSEIVHGSLSGLAIVEIPRRHRRQRGRILSGAVRKSKYLLTGMMVASLGCAWEFTAQAQEVRRSNWTSADAQCANYDDLRKPVLGSIGVKIDAIQPWAEGFRRALSFWNTVLAANFHEEPDLDSCAIRIVNAGPEILGNAIVARSQLTKWDTFRGKIAVSGKAATGMDGAEIYGIAVHELGHMLGLKHNASNQSVMYFLNVDGTEGLDRNDILDLGAHHKLRVPTELSSNTVISIAAPIPRLSGSFSPADWSANSPAYLGSSLRGSGHQSRDLRIRSITP